MSHTSEPAEGRTVQAARPAHVSKRAVQQLGGVSGIEAATKSVEVASVPSYAPVPPAVL